MISVITPSFRNSNWLKLCIASVADQDVQTEHIVQDAGSDDGTLDWLPHDNRVKAFIEKDAGMYDAVNRGLRRAKGDILAYLNCDEQYLPEALRQVEQYFADHPEVDVLFGDFIVVDADGDYLFHRKVLTPRLYHTWVSHLQAFTCGTFFRRRIIDDLEIFFDPRLRVAGDAEWMLRLLRQHVRMDVLRKFTSTFTLTGANLGETAEGHREAAELAQSAPWAVRTFKPLLILQHRLRRMMHGIYFQKPFSYAIYSMKNPTERIVHQVAKPSFRWNAQRAKVSMMKN